MVLKPDLFLFLVHSALGPTVCCSLSNYPVLSVWVMLNVPHWWWKCVVVSLYGPVRFLLHEFWSWFRLKTHFLSSCFFFIIVNTLFRGKRIFWPAANSLILSVCTLLFLYWKIFWKWDLVRFTNQACSGLRPGCCFWVFLWMHNC